MNETAPIQGVDGGLAIRVSGLGKAFPLSRTSPGTFGFSLFRRSKEAQEQFWALKDVSFEVMAGRALGILGLNGAGKSTLLKLLAATMQPSAGTLDVKGRVQLLQLGAGFEPDLSGRQNIVADARARGVAHSEIERRLSSVEAFADIGRFFDQPMKTYSSGMAARVAFGTAFAIDPEILIVDEALAVGDAAFVNKCFRKIQEVRDRGTTLLFTSHSADAVLKLCDEGIVLHKGELIASGSAREAVKAYSTIVLGKVGRHDPTASLDNEAAISIPDLAERPSTPDSSVRPIDDVGTFSACPLYNEAETVFGAGGARIVGCDFRVNGARGEKRTVQLGSQIELRFRVAFDEAVREPNFGFTLNDAQGVVFYGINQKWKGQTLHPAKAGEVRTFWVTFKAKIGGGSWFMAPAIADGTTVLQQRADAIHLDVFDVDRSYVGQGWLDLAFCQEHPPTKNTTK